MNAGDRAFVLDAGIGRVFVYDAGVRVFARDVTTPGLHQLAADASGRLLVTEPARGAVCRFTPDLVKDAGFGSDGCIAVKNPVGVGALPGRVLVTSDPQTIFVFDNPSISDVEEARVSLDSGWHALDVSYTGRDAYPYVELRWRTPSGGTEYVPSANLAPPRPSGARLPREAPAPR